MAIYSLINADNVRFLINKSFQKHDLPDEWIHSEVIGQPAEAYIESQLGDTLNRLNDDPNWSVGGQHVYQLYSLAIEYRVAAMLLPLVVPFDENAERKRKFLVESADEIIEMLRDADSPPEEDGE